MRDIRRIQIELTETKLKHIESIMSECGVRTKKEFLNSALTLFEWSLREIQSGRIIVSIEESGSGKGKAKEITMPWMSHVNKDNKITAK